jgi:hypothetical protein
LNLNAAGWTLFQRSIASLTRFRQAPEGKPVWNLNVIPGKAWGPQTTDYQVLDE